MPKPRRRRVLVVDDRLEMAETVADALTDRGYEAVALASSREALRRMKSEPFDALITDLRMPEVDGLNLLTASRAAAPERPVLVMTAFGAIDSAIESIRQGAYHYLTKPFKMEELVLFLERALEDAEVRGEARALRSTLQATLGVQNLAGGSPAMRRVLDVVARVAPTDASVLLLGETGTGKSLLASTLHALSPRASRRLVPVNCAALPENLLESELFGHARGAFTGATADRAGLFVDAEGGTLFLDEIGEMSPALQAKLLHVLETGTVRPVGSGAERTVDVRILAATHRDLREQVQAGAFREDLLYRLEVVTLEVPALRHRREDLPALLEHFLQKARAKHPGSRVERLSPAARDALRAHNWPGNVRELAHLMERLVLLAPGAEVAVEDLPASLMRPASQPTVFGELMPMRELQRRYAAWVYEQLGGHRARAAERLGVDVKTLSRWLSAEPNDEASS